MAAKIYVTDRATGVKGSFCISRPVRDNNFYTEYWNPGAKGDSARWAGSGYVFTDEKLAYAVRDLLAYREEHV